MPLTASMKAGGRHRTKQEFVYRTLRDAIMQGMLAPGERLVIDDLADQLEVSAIPVREALQLLQSESLVVLVPHAGCTVAPISRDAIIDIFTVLEGLELVAMRVASERGTDQDFAVLEQIVEAMDAAIAENHFEEWSDLNGRFHFAICTLTRLELLQDMTKRLLDRWQRVRRYFFKNVLGHGQRMQQAQIEHRAILAALRARDVEQAQALARTHNQGALASYMKHLNDIGERM